MHFQEQLKQIGLNKSESAIYLFLLEQGLSSPPQIAQGTGIARTNCYNLLLSLKNKGLIVEQTQGKRKAYIASDPEALLRRVEQKKEAIERVLPDLRALYTVRKNKPKITFYDGIEQIKEIYWQALEAKEVHAIGSIEYLTSLIPEFFEKFITEAQKRGIVFHDLLTYASRDGGKEMKEKLKGLYEMHCFKEKHGNIPTDILIWDDNIALITLEEPIFGTVLTNPLLADTFRIMFRVMWEGLEK